MKTSVLLFIAIFLAAGCVPGPVPGPCKPSCLSKYYGDGDGCGSVCTTDCGGHLCAPKPGCTANCSGKCVGDYDGCGSTCTANNSTGGCTCTANCAGKCVGDSDGCGYVCTASNGGADCCAANCAGKCVGDDDGCGFACTPGGGAGACTCIPSCAGKADGDDDGCGFTCPSVAPGPPPCAESNFTFVAWGDTKEGGFSSLSSLSNQAAQLNPLPNFTIYVGDLVDSGFDTSAMNGWKNAMNGSSNNGVFNMTLPVRGNHDTANQSGWQSFFKMDAAVASVGASNYVALTPGITYSYDILNSRFLAIDVAGEAPLITAAEISWIDQRLGDAESRGVQNAFLYFHGPIYCLGEHCTCTTRVCGTDANVKALINVLNNHPIVAATFHGHEHSNNYVHIDSTRIAEVTHPFEEFVMGDGGAGPQGCVSTHRFDYCMNSHGFATVNVCGKQLTVSFYAQGAAAPKRTWLFSR